MKKVSTFQIIINFILFVLSVLIPIAIISYFMFFRNSSSSQKNNEQKNVNILNDDEFPEDIK